MTLPEDAGHLGTNIRHLRTRRGLSQVQMAQRAGVPRATWTHLESGAANPTLAVLIKVARALQVRLEELLSTPHPDVHVTRVSELPVHQKGSVAVRVLLPESLAGLTFERMEFAPGARLVGVPHTEGTREYLTCERGAVELVVGGETHRLAPGDVVAFRGDQRHSYVNGAEGGSVAYSVIAFSPVP